MSLINLFPVIAFLSLFSTALVNRSVGNMIVSLPAL